MDEGQREPERLPTKEERAANRAKARGKTDSARARGKTEGRAGEWWGRRSTLEKVGVIAGSVVALFVVIGVIASSTGSNSKDKSSEKPAALTTTTTAQQQKGDPVVDTHSRAYIAEVQTCQVAVGLLVLELRKGVTNEVKLADESTKARDTCDTIRSNLVRMNTDHFDNQATAAWYGVDRTKSGLNALLAYIDNPEPTKLIEARNKLQEGDQDMAQGIKQINVRRRVYGLAPVR